MNLFVYIGKTSQIHLQNNLPILGMQTLQKQQSTKKDKNWFQNDKNNLFF